MSLRCITFPCLGSFERQSIWRYSYNRPVLIVKTLGFNMRVTGQHGPVVDEVESSSPGSAYGWINEGVDFSVNGITGEFAQRVEV